MLKGEKSDCADGIYVYTGAALPPPHKCTRPFPTDPDQSDMSEKVGIGRNRSELFGIHGRKCRVHLWGGTLYM